MGLPQEVLELLRTPVTIERFVNKDSFGNPVYGAAATVMSIITTISRNRGAPHPRPDTIGTPVEVRSRILVDYGDYKPFDRVTLPSGQVPTVISVETGLDDAGNNFYQQIIVEENRK